jgi:hypothetical protein
MKKIENVWKIKIDNGLNVFAGHKISQLMKMDYFWHDPLRRPRATSWAGLPALIDNHPHVRPEQNLRRLAHCL